MPIDLLSERKEPVDLLSQKEPVDLFSKVQEEPIKQQSIPEISQSPERSFIQKGLDRIKEGYQVSPEKASNITYMSNETGLPPHEVEKRYDELTKSLKLRTHPTTGEIIETGLILPIAAGIASNPVTTVASIAKFMLAKEVGERAVLPAVNAVKQAINSEPLKYEKTELREFFPEGAKDLADVAEFIVYGKMAHGVDKVIAKNPANVMGKLNTLRSSVLNKMGIKQKTGLRPLTFEELKTYAEKTKQPIGKFMSEEMKAEQSKLRTKLEEPLARQQEPVAEKPPLPPHLQKVVDKVGTEIIDVTPKGYEGTLQAKAQAQYDEVQPQIVKGTELNTQDKLKSLVESQGLRFDGIQEIGEGQEGLAVVTEPETKSTTMIKLSEVTAESLAQKKAEIRERFGLDKTDPLTTEARKYATAEEFVKSQPKVFHGAKTKITEFKAQQPRDALGNIKGIYFAENLSEAKDYGDNISEVVLDIKNPLVGNPYEEYAKAHNIKDQYSIKKADVENWIKEQGYDGIIRPKGSQYNLEGAEYVVFDPKQIKTSQQLTDIWNKAQEGKTPEPKPTQKGEPKDLLKEKAEYLSAEKWQTKLPIEPETKKVINKSQIMDSISKDFNISIRGKATQRWKKVVQGAYYGKSDLIRMRTWGELEPLTHEVAHKIDGDYKITKTKDSLIKSAPQKAQSELKALDYEPEKGRLSEGFAEYIRHYLTTQHHIQKAPEFTKFFEENVLATNRALKAKLEKARSQYDIWKKQGAENRVMQQIDMRGEHERVGVTVVDKAKKAIYDFRKNWIDGLYPIQRAVENIERTSGKKLRPSKDPYQIATMYNQKSRAIANTYVKDKVIDINTGKVLGPGLEEVLKPIKTVDEMNALIAYGVAKRALNYASRGLESGIDIQDSKFIVDKYQSEKFDMVVDGLSKWSDSLLQLLVDAGNLGPNEKAVINILNPTYLPFKRVFVDEVQLHKGAGRGYVDKGKGVQKRKGSGRPIVNPIESLMEQATDFIGRALKAKVANAFAEIADTTEGIGSLIVRVPPPMEVKNITPKDILKVIKETGVAEAFAQTGVNPEELEDLLDLDQIIQTFDNAQTYKGKENIISVWKNGKRQFYEVDKELYNSLKEIDYVSPVGAMKILSSFSGLLRLGATQLRGAFAFRNFFRDSFTSAITSKHKSTVPIVSSVKGIVSEYKGRKNDLSLAKRYKRSGGEMSGMIGYDRAVNQRVYDDILFSKLSAMGKGLHVVRHPIQALSKVIDGMRTVINVTEMGPRVNELEKSYNKYLKENPDWTEEDAWTKAYNDAQDVTVNFTRAGIFGRILNKAVAFFNAGAQGMSKLGRSFRDAPIGTTVKGLLWITPMALYNWNKNKDKQWYKNLPREYKYQNIFIETEDKIIRLPLPYDIGTVFGALPVSIADSQKDPKAMEAMMNIIEAQIPFTFQNAIPSILGPTIDVATNKNYLDIPIESEFSQMQEYSTERTKRYTTDIAKRISHGLDKTFNLKGKGLSPIQIDYLINQHTGGFSNQFRKDQTPILGEFYLYMPEKPKRQLNDFYDEYDVLSRKDASGILEKENINRHAILKGTYKALSVYRKLINTAMENDDKAKVTKYYIDITKLLERIDKK